MVEISLKDGCPIHWHCWKEEFLCPILLILMVKEIGKKVKKYGIKEIAF